MYSLRHPMLELTLTSILLVSPLASWAQSHEQRAGAYVLRSSTVGSETISQETALKHGIIPAPTRAVINVTVSKGDQTVPAVVSVAARNLTGRARDIPVRQTQENGYISYLGAYEFVNGEVLDFAVKARPEGNQETLSLRFRDRMWR